MGVVGHKLLILAMEFPPAAVGTATYAHRLAASMHAEGVEVLVLAPGQVGDRDFDHTQQYQIRRMPQTRLVVWRYLVARHWLKKILRQFSPHSLWTTNGMATRVVGSMRRFDVPIVACMRGSDVTQRLPGRGPWQRLESVAQRRCYRWAQAIAASSSFIKEMAIGKGVAGGKIFVNYPAFDFAALEKECPDDQLARQAYPFVKYRPLVLSVGRLVKQKRMDVMLAAIAQVKSQVPDICHVVVGDGPQRRSLTKLAVELGLTGTVHFVGHLPPLSARLFSLYCSAKVFALASVEEGLGNVFVEASAFGLPSVGSASGGVPEIIINGSSGFLAPPDDIGGIAEGLERLLLDENLSRQFGRHARQRAEELFSMEAMAKRCLKVLTALESHGPSGEIQVAVIGKED